MPGVARETPAMPVTPATPLARAPVVKAKANLKLALARARAKRLQKFEDESDKLELVVTTARTGKMDLETARNLSFFASHSEIGELSTGLGQYFGAIVHFAMLMCILFVFVGCYHLSEFSANNNLGNDYLVVARGQFEVVYTWCKKSNQDPKKVLISIVSQSFGSRCSDNLTGSFYNCPTICTFYTRDDGVMDESQRQEWNDGNYGDALCARHLPCGMSDLNADERFLCCVETLVHDGNVNVGGDEYGTFDADSSKDDLSAVRGNSSKMPRDVFGIQVLTTLIVLVWILNYHKQSLAVARAVNKLNVTTADYAVAVSGLGEHDHQRSDLANHMAHYGEVACCVYTKNVGALLAAEEKYQAAVAKRNEIKAFRACRVATDAGRSERAAASNPKSKQMDSKKRKHRLSRRWHAFLIFLFNSAMCGGSGSEAHLNALEAEVRRRKQKCLVASKVPVVNVGEAFVTFNYESHASNCFDDHRRPFLEKILGRFFPKSKLGAPKFRNKYLTVEVPPEPSDVLWANYGVPRQKRVLKNVVTFLGMLTALCMGIGIQIFFQRVKDQARIDSYDKALYARATGTSSSLSDVALIQTLTMISSFAIVAVNVFLSFAANQLSAWQKFPSQSEFEASLMLKLVVVHVINSILVPAAFASCPRENIVPSGTDDGALESPDGAGKASLAENGKCLWYAPGGLVESVFYLQLFNAVLPNVVAYVDVSNRIKRSFLARYARTQQMMDAAVTPPEFVLAAKYAQQCKTVAMALVYGPILPVSYVLAAFALLVTYFTDKILALKRCQKPVRQGSQSTERVVVFMNVMVPVQCVFSGVLFYDLQYPAYALACVSIWGAYALLPLNRWLRIERDAAAEDGGTGDVAFWSNMGKVGGKGRAPGRRDRRGLKPPRDEEDHARQAASRRFRSKLLNVPESELGKDRLDIYYPPMPITASEKTIAMIVEGYKLPHMITPGNPDLLRGQKEHTGGRARVGPPFAKKEVAVASEIAAEPAARKGVSIAARMKRSAGLEKVTQKVSPAETPVSGAATGTPRASEKPTTPRSSPRLPAKPAEPKPKRAGTASRVSPLRS